MNVTYGFADRTFLTNTSHASTRVNPLCRLNHVCVMKHLRLYVFVYSVALAKWKLKTFAPIYLQSFTTCRLGTLFGHPA